MREHDQRKRDHIAIIMGGEVEMPREASELDRLRPAFDPFPDLNLADVDLRTRFLGKTLSMPFLIAAMSGGVEEATAVNQKLARAAAQLGVGMELGSLRVALERPRGAVLATYYVRDMLPDLPLVGNLGVTALHEPDSLTRIAELVLRLELDALSLHVNPLHEAFQEDGTTRFAGLGERVRELVEHLPVPVGVKTVGFGAAPGALERLLSHGFAFVELHGAGGTSFTRVEAARIKDRLKGDAIEEFLDFGVPLARGLDALTQLDGCPPVVAGGGVRGGVDLFRVLALGATLGSAATPLLRAAMKGQRALEHLLETWREALRVAMFVTNTPNLTELQRRGRALLLVDQDASPCSTPAPPAPPPLSDAEDEG